ncbi:MAG: DEAD/DEAH box helicase, partial [archaeon]|nr:DEAD/DEAH box helicase [archaeon]
MEKKDKKKKLELIIEEIESLQKRINEEVPPTGKYSTQISDLASTENLSKWELPKKKFKELPISFKTVKGLTESKYFVLTPIQRATLPHSLAGRDIMGASKTGSGKTLCFLIPLLELLYRERWSRDDGLCALCILPTRELAIQVFEVINKIGRYHSFSVGMVIGGNNLNKEKDSVNLMNILIGTPGRLLQHMSETPMFSADNLKMLIIDEADRILDEGFEEEMTKIFTYLPKNRQTLLFSATLTKSMKRLFRVNLNSPEYINLSNTDSFISEEVMNELNKNELSILKTKSLNDPNNQSNLKNSNVLIPKNLNQFYTVVEAHEKINILYSFLHTHKTSKCLVFLCSCKQVRFFSEIFKKFKLGMTILDMHGRQKQGKRSSTYFTFTQKRNSVVLFATDVASRGIDFPAIDWVIQLDAPEDIPTYIHRIGRTARYKSEGNSVLFVSAKEESFINDLKIRNINIRRMKIPSNKISNMLPTVRSLLAERPELVEAAEKAVNAYIKSINLFPNKKVFDPYSIDLNKLALSYGIVSKPTLVKKDKEEDEENLDEEDEKMEDDDK